MTNRVHIWKSINKSNDDLNAVIQTFLDGTAYYGPAITVEQWRFDHYEDLRKHAYPNVLEFIDAQVKTNSSIPALESDGVNQLANYMEECLHVKIRFPKE